MFAGSPGPEFLHLNSLLEDGLTPHLRLPSDTAQEGHAHWKISLASSYTFLTLGL